MTALSEAERRVLAATSDRTLHDEIVEAVARALMRVQYPGISDAEMNAPALRWNHDEMRNEEQPFPFWHDHMEDAEAALAALRTVLAERGAKAVGAEPTDRMVNYGMAVVPILRPINEAAMRNAISTALAAAPDLLAPPTEDTK